MRLIISDVFQSLNHTTFTKILNLTKILSHEASLRRLDLVLLNARTLYPKTNKGRGLIDVTVVNPVTNVTGWIFDGTTNHMQLATNIGHAAKTAEQDKRPTTF